MLLANRLAELEGQIADGIDAIQRENAKLQRAIAEIHERRLWANVRDSAGNMIYASFRDYCETRWGKQRGTLYQMVEAGTVANEMLEAGATLQAIPDQTSVLRALKPVPNAQRVEVLHTAQQITGGRATESAVKQARDIVVPQVGASYRVVDEGNPNHGRTITVDRVEGEMALAGQFPYLAGELEPVDPVPAPEPRLSLRDRCELYRQLLQRVLQSNISHHLRSDIKAALEK